MIIKHNFTGEIIFDGDKSRLAGANLYGANLRGADLRGANLYGVCFWRCAGNRKEIKSIFVSEAYPITYTSEVLQIGCENHLIEKWWQFNDERILEMDGERALNFWREHKEFIKMTIEKFPATTKQGN